MFIRTARRSVALPATRLVPQLHTRPHSIHYRTLLQAVQPPSASDPLAPEFNSDGHSLSSQDGSQAQEQEPAEGSYAEHEKNEGGRYGTAEEQDNIVQNPKSEEIVREEGAKSELG